MIIYNEVNKWYILRLYIFVQFIKSMSNCIEIPEVTFCIRLYQTENWQGIRIFIYEH